MEDGGMSEQMILGGCLLITGHAILHYRAEFKWRIAAAWLMTGAFFLACGVAVPEAIKSQQLSNQVNALQAAGKASRMAVEAEAADWKFPTESGVLSFTGAKPQEDDRWLVKPNRTL